MTRGDFNVPLMSQGWRVTVNSTKHFPLRKYSSSFLSWSFLPPASTSWSPSPYVLESYLHWPRLFQFCLKYLYIDHLIYYPSIWKAIMSKVTLNPTRKNHPAKWNLPQKSMYACVDVLKLGYGGVVSKETFFSLSQHLLCHVCSWNLGYIYFFFFTPILSDVLQSSVFLLWSCFLCLAGCTFYRLAFCCRKQLKILFFPL